MTTQYSVPAMNNAVLDMQAPLTQNQDIRGGKHSLLQNKELYFTKLDDQTDTSYEAMVKMSPMYILYPKIVDGFVGVIFAKKPILKGVEKNNDIVKNVDMLGNGIDRISQNIATNVIENGFCATLTDYSNKNRRAFLKMINPSQFVSFRTSSDDGYPVISQFIYKEEVDVVSADDEFNTEIVERYIVLDIDANGDYRSRTFQENKANATNSDNQNADNTKAKTNSDSSNMTLIGNAAHPTKNGKKLKAIPLVLHGIDTSNFVLKKSPLQDLSDMNISIMQRTIDQTYMLHWTALPTPYIIGAERDNTSPNSIGPSKIWYIGSPDASVGMLEFSGKSAKEHQAFIDNLKDIMAATGAQILKKEGVSRETATSVLVRTASQTSLVATLVENVSDQIQTSLKFCLEWSGETIIEEDYSYSMNKDFIKVDMEPNAQIALVKSWLDGAISHKTMFNKMKEGEIVAPDKEFEDELTEIGENPPPFFKETLKIEADAKAAEEAGGDEEDDITGDNLENGNVDNPVGGEQA